MEHILIKLEKNMKDVHKQLMLKQLNKSMIA